LQILTTGELITNPIEPFHSQNVSNKQEVVIAGSGPAGLFAALHLIENRYKPVILERGKDVHERKKDIALLNRNNQLIRFKLLFWGRWCRYLFRMENYTPGRLKEEISGVSWNCSVFLGQLKKSCLKQHPHIGSDKLPQIIQNIREAIIEAGGEIHFNSRLVDFETSSDSN